MGLTQQKGRRNAAPLMQLDQESQAKQLLIKP